jgi:LmbE family N-acetylglucosaminyl deacetylase
MATAVFFHAHPDDEAIGTGGTMAKAASDGHTVVLVLGTRGEHGEPVDGVLGDGEALHDRRTVEAVESGRVLGASRVEFLGYVDSGMMGEPTNDAPDSFWQADLEEAGARLAAILRDVSADVLVVYDDHGGYGHPDHIQVHRVGHRAAQMLAAEGHGPRVYEMTMNRDSIVRGLAAMAEQHPETAELQPDFEDDFGSAEAVITPAIDVTDYIERKRASMAVHASQIPGDSFFLAMPADVFAMAFGTEWFIDPDRSRDDGPFLTALAPLT